MSNNFTVVLDAGHGGHDSGAVNGATGSREKDVVLEDALLLGKYLTGAGMDVIQTRYDDTFRSLSARAETANLNNAALISLHCNASNGMGHGFEAFTSPGQTASDVLATMMLEDYAEKVAEQHGLRARFDLRDGDPDKEARFAVLTKTKGVAVLFELGFIDNVNDEKFLTSQKARETRCRVLADSIINWAREVHGFRPRTSAKPAKMVAKVEADRADGSHTTDSVTLLKNRVKYLEAENDGLKDGVASLKMRIDDVRKALG